ncbi:hypothetical protein [Paraburkholderia tagetis]|uniref:Uncharacterized protein n=1 Tax=Paraburkholderia tagetis TaxID=2913261 RepID=A0A9X1UKH2_9BURK|nr:hypothetical protein [Paraburkholderia tagetis]MCG5074111.1 hypothetical protein [Paraburkholderia tagetis]
MDAVHARPGNDPEALQSHTGQFDKAFEVELLPGGKLFLSQHDEFRRGLTVAKPAQRGATIRDKVWLLMYFFS